MLQGKELSRIPPQEAGGLSRFGERMEKKLATTVVYWGYIGIMEKKMETIISGHHMVDTQHWRVLALAKEAQHAGDKELIELGASMRGWLLLRRGLALVFVRRLQSSHLGG